MEAYYIQMMQIWPEINHVLHFNSANTERLAQEYSAWEGLTAKACTKPTQVPFKD